MLPIQVADSPRPLANRLFTVLVVILVTSSILIGSVGPALATAHSSPAPTEEPGAINSDSSVGHHPVGDTDDAVNNRAVVVNEDGHVVSGRHVSYGDPTGRLIREYTVNGLEKTDPIEISNNTIVSEDGHSVVVEGDGVIRIFDESPVIRARYDNGTVEKLIANGTNIETTSGNNILTDDGRNVAVDRSAFTEPKFDVNILDTGDVGEGSTLNVSVRVRNVGHVTERERVELLIDDRTYSPRLVKLEPGESNKIKLRYRTRTGDAPKIDVGVVSPHDQDTVTVEIAKPNFRLDVPSTGLGVAANETLSVPLTVTRTGGNSKDTYATDLVINGDAVDSRLMKLQPESSDSVTFTYETSEEDTPSVRATIVGPNNTNTTIDIPVNKPILAVNQLYVPENITEYEQTNVTATLENFDTAAKNQTVRLVATQADGSGESVVAEKQVVVGNRSAKNVTFNYHTTPEYHPSHSLTVRTEDHEKSKEITTLPTSVFQISSVPAGNQTSTNGTQHTISPVIENIGHEYGTVNLTYSVDGKVERVRNLAVSAGQSTSDEYTITIPSNETVAYETATQDESINSVVSVSNSTESGTAPGQQDGEAGGQTVVEKSGGFFSGISLPSLPVIIGVVVCCLVVFLVATLAV